MNYHVGGCDVAAWPPMSEQIQQLGIEMDIGWEQANVRADWDQIIIGNVLSRGNPLVEQVLAQQLPFVSGPQWLYEQVLRKRKVLAVAGTHGKTSTTAMLAWILQQSNIAAGFLLGGKAQDFEQTATLGDASAPFVIEADEYDSAFFDKRPKFLHYYPHIALLNNLEFDHADIYADSEAIEKQFHYLLRSVPPNGQIIYRGNDPALQRVIEQGVWSPCQSFALASDGISTDWLAQPIANSTHFEVYYQGNKQGLCQWTLLGHHNIENALGAIASVSHLGVTPQQAIHALETFHGVRRRLEAKANSNGIVVYDDFAHHPTAINASLQAVRNSMSSSGRVLAVFEPASNSMKQGAHCAGLAQAFVAADAVFAYQAPALQWSLQDVLPQACVCNDTDALLAKVCAEARVSDHIVVMSNSSFDSMSERIASQIGMVAP